MAFFATGDTIVSNNLVLNLYQHINAPEARLYLSRQLFEEAVHVQFYLTLLDTYVPDPEERAQAFAAVGNIASIRAKAQFCYRWIDSIADLHELRTRDDRRAFLLNLICFAACIEGLFFYGAFAYVYFLRSRGLLHGLASGTNWVFRDESMHMDFAFDVARTVRAEEPDLVDEEFQAQVQEMLAEAVDAETAFAQDLLGGGVAGMTVADMRSYLEHVADRRLAQLGFAPHYCSRNPFAFPRQATHVRSAPDVGTTPHPTAVATHVISPVTATSPPPRPRVRAPRRHRRSRPPRSSRPDPRVRRPPATATAPTRRHGPSRGSPGGSRHRSSRAAPRARSPIHVP
ncbi:MAG: ribonucleotide-diphosphate reductase subunit beta [Geodermatophilaceae bacterium]